MTSASTPDDDAAAVRSLLGPANPVPDPSLNGDELAAARAGMGMARAASTPPPRPRGRFVVAGAVALVSVATLVAVVAIPTGQGNDTTSLATGPGAKAVGAAVAATEASRTARGLLTIRHGGQAITADGIGDFAGGDARAEIAPVADATSRRITVVRTGAGIYARLPDGMNPLSRDKPWVSVDAVTLARLTQLALGDLGAQITGAPLDALTYLRAVSGDVALVGPDTTRGEPTTHYRGSIEPSRITGQLPEALRPPAPAAGGAAAAKPPADLWIDAQGRLRKLVISVDPNTLASSGRSASTRPSTAAAEASTITLELWDFGVPVEVTAPPAEEVADVSGLLGSFAQNLSRP